MLDSTYHSLNTIRYPLKLSRDSISKDDPERRHVCCVCGSAYSSRYDLHYHAGTRNHRTIKCRLHLCTFLYSYWSEYIQHRKIAHPEIQSCHECKESFDNLATLEDHARATGHTCFFCEHLGCEKTFSRLDSYQRHQKAHQDDVQRHPCKYCRKYRGANGFKRKDHLTQHLRNYHHIGEDEASTLWGRYSCPHGGCSEHRKPVGGHIYVFNDEHPFRKLSDYTKHMKKVHDESQFPCPEFGCDRVGGKGYSRKRDLVKHQIKCHGTTKASEANEEDNA
ncbi:hypothetical protein K469DRAFT_664858 [Zopfia rhizophila CBS 207.26]|uniref:C2H2-type domain-containing protein n=1 Tax=Zopfia rhizophila CBS 207.26 TaxID=1314779 RepID=A0A6A6E525_9PEZI|nr:hypothetical protein K469DRAFT_664858 [Zopfia rhizophila CBS 207.26]